MMFMLNYYLKRPFHSSKIKLKDSNVKAVYKMIGSDVEIRKNIRSMNFFYKMWFGYLAFVSQQGDK